MIFLTVNMRPESPKGHDGQYQAVRCWEPMRDNHSQLPKRRNLWEPINKVNYGSAWESQYEDPLGANGGGTGTATPRRVLVASGTQ